jgi:osmotically-inducible protein OsmY
VDGTPIAKLISNSNRKAAPMSADLALALQVRDNLTAARRDLIYVAVLVLDGEVRLRGSVASYHLRQVAVERTRRIPGVRNVVDEMQVPSNASPPL